MTKVLGIDPGSRITGYGLLLNCPKSNYIKYLSSGCIRTKGDNWVDRIIYLYIQLKDLIDNLKPDVVAIESVFLAKNPSSALKLGHARGAAIIAAKQYDLPLFEYSARYVKKATTGYGASNKSSMKNMIKNLLHLSKEPTADAADALAIALAHCQVRSYEQVMEQATTIV